MYPRSKSFTLSTASSVKTQVAKDYRQLSNEDLKSLRKNDPLEYYSLPGIRWVSSSRNAAWSDDNSSNASEVTSSTDSCASSATQGTSRKSSIEFLHTSVLSEIDEGHVLKVLEMKMRRLACKDDEEGTSEVDDTTRTENHDDIPDGIGA